MQHPTFIESDRYHFSVSYHRMSNSAARMRVHIYNVAYNKHMPHHNY